MSEKVRRFEDLVAWQKGRALAREIFRLTECVPLRGNFALRDQLQRSSLSVPSNIAEGFERGSAADFHRFLTIAKGSCAEMRTQLYVARDVELLSQTEADKLLTAAEEVSRIIGGLRTAVGRKRK